MPLIGPLVRTQVSESLLYPLRVVESLDISGHRLSGIFLRAEMNPVTRFFLQDREETFTPRVVSRRPYMRKFRRMRRFPRYFITFSDAYRLAAITVEDTVRRQVTSTKPEVSSTHRNTTFRIMSSTSSALRTCFAYSRTRRSCSSRVFFHSQ